MFAGGQIPQSCVVGKIEPVDLQVPGANINNILDYEKYFPEVAVIKLEQNYRSTQTILDAANEVIQNNAEERKEGSLDR
ncbi:MAG: 3'-5' exonuclease [Gallintestinimicrobium sp.]